MHFPNYSNGSFDPSPNSQQNHASHTVLPPPPPAVQQAYMYPPPPPPPPPSSLATTQAHQNTVPETTQSYTNISYLYPSTQNKTQTVHESSQQFHSHLPPVSMLPPPPPLPPGTILPVHTLPLPLPPPRSSSPFVADSDCKIPESAKHVCGNVSLNSIERTVVEDSGPSKKSYIHCDKSEKAEHGSLICTDPDIEMEDDITLPENENCPIQLLNCGSDQVPEAYLNTEQAHQQRILTETNSINFQTEVPDDGSREASSSPYSGRVKNVPECGLGSDMYDPFVDSFEPVSVKLDCIQEHEPTNDDLYTLPKASISSNRPLNIDESNQALSESDMTARVSVSSNKPPDIEENTNTEAMVSRDNDEFGENAAEEGYSHETGTPNSHNENPNSTSKKKSRGELKEKEPSRSSMKLFKVALTRFVKDVLKPSWRQGNMSKEAFKTIVKRAVEKVSNSMEGRRIPKSKAKIDRYIDSSQHKLKKLVMGYVDKYVKA